MSSCHSRWQTILPLVLKITEDEGDLVDVGILHLLHVDAGDRLLIEEVVVQERVLMLVGSGAEVFHDHVYHFELRVDVVFNYHQVIHQPRARHDFPQLHYNRQGLPRSPLPESAATDVFQQAIHRHFS